MPILSQLIDDWIAAHQIKLDKELDYFAHLPTDEQAILLAAKGRGENNVKFDHQRRLNLVALDTFADQLVWLVDLGQHFQPFQVFSIHPANGKWSPWRWDLAVYDTALRIGWRLV